MGDCIGKKGIGFSQSLRGVSCIIAGLRFLEVVVYVVEDIIMERMIHAKNMKKGTSTYSQ